MGGEIWNLNENMLKKSLHGTSFFLWDLKKSFTTYYWKLRIYRESNRNCSENSWITCLQTNKKKMKFFWLLSILLHLFFNYSFLLKILCSFRYHPIARKMIEADMKKENDYDNNIEETTSSNTVEKESFYSSMTSPSSLAIGALVAATSILLFFLRNKIE